MPSTPNDLPTSGSPFWKFSLELYGAAGVGAACVALQDEHGVDVNVLLFVLWLAQSGRALTGADVRAIDAAVRNWRSMAVVPLRTLRRALKAHATLDDTQALDAFRMRVKGIELEAERLQQEAMYARWSAAVPGQRADSVTSAARANLAAYAETLDTTFAAAHVDTLVGALPATLCNP